MGGHAGRMKIIVLLVGVSFLLGAGDTSGSSVGSAAPTAPTVSATPRPENQGPSWTWPLTQADGKPPAVVRPFEPPARRWLAGHRGVDLAADPAAPVVAAGAGTVTFAGTLFGEDIVVVSHGGVRTSYEPVAARVHVGDKVARGDVLGTLTADSPTLTDGRRQADERPGPVLHWGLLAGHGRAVRYYDPLLLLGPAHLRLEPAA